MKLSKEESDLLCAAAKGDGRILQMASDPFPDFYRAGGIHFPAEIASATSEQFQRYKEAFRSLERQALIEHDENNVFLLTVKGWEIAKGA